MDDLLLRYGRDEGPRELRSGERGNVERSPRGGCPEIERLSKPLFFTQAEVRGDLKADVWLDSLHRPVTRLPAMKGTLNLTNGFLKLPSMAKPLENIGLSCSFSGEHFVVDLSGIKAGASLLADSHLVVDGLDSPSFALAVDMTRFDPRDFATKSGKPFRLPVISEGSLMARAKGTFLLKAHELDVGGMTGKEFFVSGAFGDRALAVNEGRLTAGTGSVSFQGNARFVEEPRVDVRGELKDLTAREVFSLFGASTDILDGVGSISGSLSLAGRSSEEMARTAGGAVTISSRDGVVRKWNLLSKLLALTERLRSLSGTGRPEPGEGSCTGG